MKTYWDYSERERSEMTEEQVRALLDTELMTKGVIKIEAPKLRPVPELPNLQTAKWYETCGILFKTAEDAAKFLALEPHKKSYNYEVGNDFQYAEKFDDDDYSTKRAIKELQVYAHQDIINQTKLLHEIKSAKEKNRQEEAAYSKATKDMNKVLDGVWENWYECQRSAAQHKKVTDTYEEYLTLTSKDASLAETFLLKAFTREKIQEAEEWTGKTMLIMPAEMAAPAVEAKPNEADAF